MSKGKLHLVWIDDFQKYIPESYEGLVTKSGHSIAWFQSFYEAFEHLYGAGAEQINQDSASPVDAIIVDEMLAPDDTLGIFHEQLEGINLHNGYSSGSTFVQYVLRNFNQLDHFGSKSADYYKEIPVCILTSAITTRIDQIILQLRSNGINASKTLGQDKTAVLVIEKTPDGPKEFERWLTLLCELDDNE